MRSARSRLASSILIVFVLACCGRVPTVPLPTPPRPAAGARATGVLFIGNSLTYTNDLPAMVEELARVAGAPAIRTRTMAAGGYSLEDHWNQGDARRALAAGGWSLVVLQQGPSSLPESEVLLLRYARLFDAEARSSGARTALYMVWPSRDRLGDFDAVSRSYTHAAEDVHGVLLPAGEAWRSAWRSDPTLSLYGSDGFHPGPLGTYLAALVIYQRITGRSPVGLPPGLTSPGGRFPPVILTPAQARLLQEAAVDANVRFGPG